MKDRLIAIGNSVSFGCILHLLFPGLGYFLWRDYLFGLFVFLVAVIAAGLVLVSFLVTIPFWAKLFLFGLPCLFYLLSFVDLVRLIKKKRSSAVKRVKAAAVLLTGGLLFQALTPVAPGNFFFRNRPEFFRAIDNNYSPVIRRGDLVSASRLAYTADLGLQEISPIKPVFHTIPQRCDIVRFVTRAGEKRIGIVIGLPSEQVEVREGRIIVDGLPVADCSQLSVGGEWPLTEVDELSILVACLRLGRVDKVYFLNFEDIVGKVSRLF